MLQLVFAANTIAAHPTSSVLAKSIAQQFIQSAANTDSVHLTLQYAELFSKGDTAYFVFDINYQNGFIIIAGDDGAHPVIAYSLTNPFVQLPAHAEFTYWLSQRKNELRYIRSNQFLPTEGIHNEWTIQTGTNSKPAQGKKTMSKLTTLGTTAYPGAVAPLMTTEWNPSPYFNALCPGGSVTGCVATAMGQIMYYWQYPAHGTGSNSYCACTPNYVTIFGEAENSYGTLTANFANTTYNWSAMPSTTLSAANSAVATLMYDIGVSVDMNYGSESNAYMISENNSACAQTAYATYFGYDHSTLKGILKVNYSDSGWINVIKNELANKRPVQMGGMDPTSFAGHSWVCDGYEANNMFHFNWGWGGASNCYCTLDAMNPAGTSYAFTENQEALIGIQPLVVYKNDAGIAAIHYPEIINCTNSIQPMVALKNYGTDTLKQCTLKYVYDNLTDTITYKWNGNLFPDSSVNVLLNTTNLTIGQHVITCQTYLPNDSADQKVSNDINTLSFAIDSVNGTPLDYTQGFEGTTNLPQGWSLSNRGSNVTWQVTNAAAKTGIYSLGFNNCQGHVDDVLMGTSASIYTTGFDLTSQSPLLTFDVAYAVNLFDQVTLADTLVIYASLDCGTSWNQVYMKGGSKLATAPAYNTAGSPGFAGCFIPTSAQWRNDTINLSAYAGMSNVVFQIQNRSDWGSWIFMDNFSLSTPITTGLNNLKSKTTIQCYPNPTNDFITIASTLPISSLTVRNVLGQILYLNPEVNALNSTVQTQSYPPGVYEVQVQTGSAISYSKFIRQ